MSAIVARFKFRSIVRILLVALWFGLLFAGAFILYQYSRVGAVLQVYSTASELRDHIKDYVRTKGMPPCSWNDFDDRLTAGSMTLREAQAIVDVNFSSMCLLDCSQAGDGQVHIIIPRQRNTPKAGVADINSDLVAFLCRTHEVQQ